MKERYPLNGESLRLRREACVGCGECKEVCPHAVFELETSDGKTTARIKASERCMACGACALNCPAAAISVETGVGCAAAILDRMLGRTGECSCGGGDSGDVRCC